MRNEDEDGKGLYANGAAFHGVSHGQRRPISITVMNRFLSHAFTLSSPRLVIGDISGINRRQLETGPDNRVATGLRSFRAIK